MMSYMFQVFAAHFYLFDALDDLKAAASSVIIQDAS
jgi:hypothetical protein